MPRYVIWSEEHRAWWRPNSAGYTTSMAQAGLYTEEHAAAIVRSANGGGTFCEVAMAVPDDFAEILSMPSGGR